jgi:guanine deaminase
LLNIFSNPDGMNSHEFYLNEAFDEAFLSVRYNIGGPFGAVVVMHGNIIGRGGNRVITLNDPTAHAEIVAIREACKTIGNFDLTGAVLYTTCEPCPMCLSAIYWANIHAVYYGSTRFEAEAIGFKDNHIYEELDIPAEERLIPFKKLENTKAAELFLEWDEKKDKITY